MAHVCVTGGSGFLASWLIKLLLERGYHVRATVRDPGDFTKTAHLLSLRHARERLELFKADLLDDKCFDTIVNGCEGVFHTASPVNMIPVNPEEELIKPAVKGTLNVLHACAKSKSVRRVLLTSSMAAVVSSITNNKETTIVDESAWSDQSYWREKGFWYGLSKLLAEETAMCFAKEKGLDLITIVPGMIAGRPLQPNLDTGSKLVMEILTGKQSFLQNVAHAWVDVRDVAEAHILAFETPSASGRYLCARQVMDSPTLLALLLKLIPHQLPQPLLQRGICQICNQMEMIYGHFLRGLGVKQGLVTWGAVSWLLQFLGFLTLFDGEVFDPVFWLNQQRSTRARLICFL